jgi:hypothetical protein
LEKTSLADLWNEILIAPINFFSGRAIFKPSGKSEQHFTEGFIAMRLKFQKLSE